MAIFKGNMAIFKGNMAIFKGNMVLMKGNMAPTKRSITQCHVRNDKMEHWSISFSPLLTRKPIISYPLT